MRNKVLLGIFILLGIGVWALLATGGSSQPDQTNTQPTSSQDVATSTQNAPNTFAFACPNDYQFAIRYSGEENQNAEIHLPGRGEVYELQVARSGSGARYTNEGESIVFWEHQGEARIEKDGELVREGCTITDRGEEAEDYIHNTFSQEKRSTLLEGRWQWQSMVSVNEANVTPDNPEDFVLTLSEDGSFSATTDCNNIGGSVSVGTSSNALTFEPPFRSTRKACGPDTQESEFTDMLTRVHEYTINDDGQLFLLFSSGAGSMEFSPVE